jgi:uncharacterized protein YpmS
VIFPDTLIPQSSESMTLSYTAVIYFLELSVMTYSVEGGNETSLSTKVNVQIRFQMVLAKNRIIYLELTVFHSIGQIDSPCDAILRTPLVDDVHMHSMTGDSNNIMV